MMMEFTDLRVQYPEAIDIAFNVKATYENHRILTPDGMKQCALLEEDCIDLIIILPYEIKLFGYLYDVTPNNVIIFNTEDLNFYFVNAQLDIIDIKSFYNSILILCSDRRLYAYIDPADQDRLEPLFEPQSDIGCAYGKENAPCILGVEGIDAFDISSNGILYLITNDGTILQQSAPLGYISYSISEGTLKKVFQFNEASNPLLIDIHNNLYALGRTARDSYSVHFKEFESEMRIEGTNAFDIKFIRRWDSSLIIVTHDNSIYTRGSFGTGLRHIPVEPIVDARIVPYHMNDFLWITKNKLYFSKSNLNPVIFDVILEKVAIYKYQEDPYCHVFMKTVDHRLAYVKVNYNSGDLCMHVIIDTHYIEDVDDSIIAVREDGKVVYYGIGYNTFHKFGKPDVDKYIFKDIIKVGDGSNMNGLRESFAIIEFDDVPVDNIKQVYHSSLNMFVITKDGTLYGRGCNVFRAISKVNTVTMSFMVPIQGLFSNDEICRLHVSDTPILFIETCDGKVYQQGYYSKDILYYNDMGYVQSRCNDSLSCEIEMPHPVKHLKYIHAVETFSSLLFNFVSIDCIDDECIIDNDLDIIDEEIVLNNSTTYITSNVTITDGSIIVNTNTSGETVPIIVDGGQLTLNSTTLIYDISHDLVFESIQDGQSIIIIDTRGDGVIDGQFESLVLRKSNVEDQCKEIVGTLEQSSEQISILFKVNDTCNKLGIPWWAILIIVLGIVCVITIIGLIVYFCIVKKRMPKTKKQTRKQIERGENGNNMNTNEMYKGKALKNPVYENKV